MTGFLGIDHPLIVVRDLDTAIERFAALGFTMAPKSRHPWGTSTCIAIMDRSLIELVSIYDEKLLDLLPAGDFRFGRYIQQQLAEREGISLIALHSTDADGDAEKVEARGIVCQGTIKFGRDVTLPDGTPDRTSTTLKILQDPALPRFSNFICQQHRPDLIYVPKWSTHRNGASSYSQVTILTALDDQPRLKARLAGLYGNDALFDLPDGFAARTGNGIFAVTDRRGIEQRYGDLPPELAAERQPFCAAIHIKVPDIAKVAGILDETGISYRRIGRELRLADAAAYGNVFINFSETYDPV